VTKIIASAINKGGVGKTSLISNLAGSVVKEFDCKVLIIDSDGQGNLGLAFNIVPNKVKSTLYDVLVHNKPIKDSIIPITENLDILPSNIDMNFIEFDILPNLDKFKDPFYMLKNALNDIVDDYDYIFIDTPPAMGLVVGNVLTAATDVIIPYVPEVFSVNGLIRIHTEINNFTKSFNNDLNILGIVGMMVDLRTTLHQDMLQQARAHCYNNNINMFETIIPRSIRFAHSNLDGIPAVWQEKPNHLINSYYELLNELIESGVFDGKKRK